VWRRANKHKTEREIKEIKSETAVGIELRLSGMPTSTRREIKGNKIKAETASGIGPWVSELRDA